MSIQENAAVVMADIGNNDVSGSDAITRNELL